MAGKRLTEKQQAMLDEERQLEMEEAQMVVFGSRAEMLWQIVEQIITIFENEVKNIRDPETQAQWGAVVTLHRVALREHGRIREGYRRDDDV